MIATAVGDYKRERNKLSPEQEARLLDEMQALLSPKRDEQGNIVEPAKIPSDYDFDKIAASEIKDLYMPAEQHVEGQILTDMLYELDNEVLPHLQTGEERKHNNEGNKLTHAIEEGDQIAAAAITQDNVTAAEMVETPTSSAVLFQTRSLADLSGVGAEKTDFTGMGQETKLTLASAFGTSQNMEFDPTKVPGADNTHVASGTAA